MNKLYLKTPDNFSFKSTVYSHGWADLRPFELPDNLSSIAYVYKGKLKTPYLLTISDKGKGQLEIKTDSQISERLKSDVVCTVKRMFRLDEDYDEFYQLVSKAKEFSWVLKYKAGRMLRCGNLWEDMVKMLCTTNCTWRLTQIMTENLVTKLGAIKKTYKSELPFNAFPESKDIASKNEEYLRNEIKMGYRAPYLLEFARSIEDGNLNLSDFEEKTLPTDELYKKIRRIKGFGDYAVSNLLKLLGRYDYMGADSWSRQKFFEKHQKGKAVDDNIIQSHYQKFGKWAGLFFWMDVSEDWYEREIPW